MKTRLHQFCSFCLYFLIGIFGLLIVSAFFIRLQNWQSLVLLQNTDEKRATGGFMGTIAVVQHRGWSLKQWQIYDIYESDGQIKEFLPAPAAVSRYLADGKNELHLSDANWERDFPTSSRQINTLFARAGRPQPNFIISLNLPVIEKLIDQVGGITIDSSMSGKLTLTGDNFAQLAHSNRADFYPGDTQKTAFLRPAALALKEKIAHLPWQEKMEVAAFFWEEAQSGSLHFFSFSPFYQTIFQTLNIAGDTRQAANCQQIYWVESNVGANKSNRLVFRTTNTASDGNTFTITSKWNNRNSYVLSPNSSFKDRLHYANYQRLLLPPGVDLISAAFDDQPLDLQTFDRRTVADASGEVWQEVGFLVIINEQSIGQLQVQLQSSPSATKKSTTCWQVDFN